MHATMKLRSSTFEKGLEFAQAIRDRCHLIKRFVAFHIAQEKFFGRLSDVIFQFVELQLRVVWQAHTAQSTADFQCHG